MMRNEIEIEFDPFASLNDVVLKLQKLSCDNNKNYFINYYGIKLESKDIDIDKAYIKCFGFDTKYARENMKEYFKKEADLKSSVIREMGKKYINPLKHPLWDEIFLNPNFDFFEIEVALEIMQTLKEETDILIAEEKFKNRHLSGMQGWGVLVIVLTLSERGVEFYKFMTRYFTLDKSKKLRIKKQEELNKKLSIGKKLDDALEELKDYKMVRITIHHLSSTVNRERFADILIKNDNSFEGITMDDNYITGTFVNNTISFIHFNNDNQEHFCGNLTNNPITIKKELIGNNEYKNNGSILIELNEINHDFETEIILNEEFSKIKRYFNKKEKDIYNFYINNKDLIIESSLLYLDEEINSSELDRYYKKVLNKRMFGKNEK